MNFYSTNVLQMVLLPIIALLPVVIVCTRFTPEKYYPYAVFSIAITLLYHTALISPYIWGWDIQYEYYLTNVVIQDAIWDFTAYDNCNAMLSLMTLAPTYSILLGMGLDWIFKIIYPFFFALVPLGLYAVFQRQTDDKISFLACFFFMSFYVFYTEMLTLARQEVAELFLALIILSMVDRGISGQQKSALFLILSASLVVSHYGLSYIFMLVVLLALTIAIVEYYVGIQSYAIQFFNWINRKIGVFIEFSPKKIDFKPSVRSLRFVTWYGFVLLVWYIYMTGASSFISSVTIAQRVLKNISSDLFSPDAAQGMAIIVSEATTPLHEIGKYLHLLTIFFIVVGFITIVVTRQRVINFDVRYLLLSFGALSICIGGVALPYFASALNTSRLYQMSLILLAPFSIIGMSAFISRLGKISNPGNRPLQIVAMFLGVFLLFNCGWIYDFTHDQSTSFALNTSLNSPVFSDGEVRGVMWLIGESTGNMIYCDMYNLLLFRKFSGDVEYLPFPMAISTVSEPSYLFFGTSNINNGEVTLKYGLGVSQIYERRPMPIYTSNRHAIYSSGYSLICYH